MARGTKCGRETASKAGAKRSGSMQSRSTRMVEQQLFWGRGRPLSQLPRNASTAIRHLGSIWGCGLKFWNFSGILYLFAGSGASSERSKCVTHPDWLEKRAATTNEGRDQGSVVSRRRQSQRVRGESKGECQGEGERNVEQRRQRRCSSRTSEQSECKQWSTMEMEISQRSGFYPSSCIMSK